MVLPKRKRIVLLVLLLLSMTFLMFYYPLRYSNQFRIDLSHQQSPVPTSTTSEIPKLIFTYWHGDVNTIPEKVSLCIQSWRITNPNHQIVLFTKSNLPAELSYIYNLKHASFSQRIADFIRIALLEMYGGIWIDASVLLTTSLDWVHERQQKTKGEYVGFYLDTWTRIPEFPVIENWFMAAVPKSKFIRDWKKAFFSMNDYATPDEYVRFVKANYDLQGITPSLYSYLSMHLAHQVAIQSHGPGYYNLALWKAEDGPYAYLIAGNWNHYSAIIEFNSGKHIKPIIKFRNWERFFLSQKDLITLNLGLSLNLIPKTKLLR